MTLLAGDCLALLPELAAAAPGSVDLVVTDPPYGMNYQSNRRVHRERFSRIRSDDNLLWLDGWFDAVNDTMAANSAIYCFCSWHNVETFKTKFCRHFRCKNILVWVKNNHGSGDLTGAYAPKHEFVLFGHKGRSLLRDKRIPDVLEFPRTSGALAAHPTEKNADMIELFVRNSSDPGATVLDPFMGVGTTGVACARAGRKFIGIEIDPDYFSEAERRIAAAKAGGSNA